MPTQQPASSSGIKWNEVTWYSRLGTIILLLGVVPTLCFYIGVQYAAVQQQPIVAQTMSATNKATESYQLSEVHSATTTALYLKLKSILAGYSASTSDDAPQYLVNTASKMNRAEESANTFIAAYCDALTAHYGYFGGGSASQVGNTLFDACVKDAFGAENNLLKYLYENDSDAKSVLKLE